MSFLEIINKKKVILISIFLFIYIIINLFEGERGLISYFEKKSTFKNLSEEKALLTKKLKLIEKENSLLTDVIDLDYRAPGVNPYIRTQLSHNILRRCSSVSASSINVSMALG